MAGLMKMTDNPLFCTPSIRRGNGLGHLYRSGWLAESIAGAFLYLPEADRERFFSMVEIREIFAGRPVLERIITNLPDKNSPVILLDRRSSPLEDRLLFPGDSIFIGLDEGGVLRRDCIYLADTLPRLAKRFPPNIQSPMLLEGPETVRIPPVTIRKILVSFGGEDPGNLSRSTLEFLENINRRQDIGEKFILTLCLGPLLTEREEFFRLKFIGIEILLAPDSLKDELSRWDLIITSFGLTAFESVRAGVPVILRNPSSYHRKLSLKAGFISPSFKPGRESAFLGLLDEPAALLAPLMPGLAGDLPTLPELLESKDFKVPVCPACGLKQSGSDRVGVFSLLARFPERSWYRCTRCSIVFQNLHNIQTVVYGDDYFFEDYQKQYGKTYLDDFSHLRSMARERLNRITGLLPGGGKLLEIGCAYGPFLLEAEREGFIPFGIDVAGGAVEYVKNELKLNARKLSMESLDFKAHFGHETADVICLWYVIEHFEDCRMVLEKLASLQKRGGVLAFSTPNLRGISGIRNRKSFLTGSPIDHYHVWSPRIARKVLKLYGYRVRKMRITGHHPERFPLGSGRNGFYYRFILGISRLMGLGDTFEVYAEKITGTGEA